jgi:hypothetical protein
LERGVVFLGKMVVTTFTAICTRTGLYTNEDEISNEDMIGWGKQEVIQHEQREWKGF